jgi:hypothetical protein
MLVYLTVDSILKCDKCFSKALSIEEPDLSWEHATTT